MTLVALCAVVMQACRETNEGVRTEFVGSYEFSATERRTIARIAADATREVRTHLPGLPPQVRLRVRSGTDVIPELGSTAAVAGNEMVVYTIDPSRPEGVVKIVESYLRQTLFHDYHHLVRGARVPPSTLMDHVITEGMATAFERDFVRAPVPWGEYPDDVSTWVTELMQAPPDAKLSDWMTRRLPDGRRWVGMRAGTYLVDQAMTTLNRTAAQLVSMPTAEVLAAAGVAPRSRTIVQ